ncbi:hypothetical protein RUM44_010593 [Polyplax serrata]|uniref:Peptidase S1 domain-containing protein n=1 Tax=Polyplax serrata TaxID=468196 RepID=A0ABR1AW09_POLSC
MENRSQRDKTWKGSRASVLSGTNSPISGIFSTKKVFILDSPRTGDNRSDIPNLEAGGDSEHKRTHSPVHYHTGSVVPGETSNKREYADEGSTETDLNIFFYKTQKDDNLLSHYEMVELNDDEKLAKVQPSFIRSLDTSNEYLREDISTISSKKRIARRSVRPMNSYETEDIADILTKQDKWTKLEGNNLDVDKEAFKANSKTVFESFSLTVPSAFNTYESYSQETNELDDASKKTSTININEEESEEATETLEMKKGIIRNTTSEEHIDKKDVKYMSDIEVLQEVEIQKSYFTTSNSNDFIPKESVTEVQITDSQVTERTSNTYGGYATPTTWSESPRMAEQNPPVDTISLAEAIKRRNDKRKYLFLNSRVVGGSSDVRLPTASDVTKPPVSAFESLKTGQQLSFSPSGSSTYLFPYQMCLFANPYVGSKPSIRSTQSRTFPLGVPSLFSLDKADPLKQFARTPTQQNFLTFSVNNYASPPARQQFHYPSTAPGLSNFPPQQMLLHNAPMPSTQPIFCTYLQPPLFQFPTMPGTADFAHGKSFNFEEDMYQKPRVENVLHSGGMIHCSDDNVACRDGSNCIPIRNWCDNQVHCQDISDEAFCSCRERVARDRICDGYLDCPGGEDELGCFGCPKSAFSCDSVISPGSCIALNKRCDGVRDCAIGNDENDCSALFPHIQTNNSYQVSHASGYLHRNWKGDWFPVCVDVSYDQWAKEACLGEIGYLPSVVEVNFAAVPDYYKGPFIVRNDDGTTSMQDHCKGHVSTYVKCPPIKCGTRAEFYNLHDIETRFKRFNELDLLNSAYYKADENATDVNDRFTILNASEIEGNTKTKSKTKREETGRVVGGRESEPRAWPWAIAIYKDGGFLCGGVILDDHWVLTAAHCMQQYWKHYYEVRGGMLRRFSFSPMEQVRVVADVIVHENYDPVIMNNDIALLRLQKPFDFNRWVRPGCLPSFRGHISNFFSTPLPGTHCIAVGWGALRERGIDADQLREVEVPIMLRCKHKEDLAGAEICAGTAEGGKDTCQGDSGGPLLCKNSQAPLAWYVAGVVSHGEGCARPGEPGAYTRISLFIDWITVNANDFRLLTIKPLATCPGFRCTSGTRLCIPAKWVCNGFTDCLEAEDEKNCTGNFPYEQYYPQLSSAGFPKSLNMRIASPSSTINTSGHRQYKAGTESTGKEEKQFLGKDIRPETEIPDAKYFYDTKVKGFEFREDARISLMELNENSKKSSTITTNLDGPPPRTPIRSAVYQNDPSVPDVYPFDIQMLHRRRQFKTLQDAQKFYKYIQEPEGTAPTAKLSVAKVRETSQHSQWEEANPIIYPVQIGSFSSADYPTEEIEQDLKSQTMPNATLEPYFFQCHEITQSIPMEYHCDGMRDCEDGSDETNCLCSDVLKRSKAELLCDGSHDCPDGSDEANCERCARNEFLCKISGECLPMSEKCNGFPKCRFGEDERNCFALSRTEKIVLNAGDDPPLEQKGFVLQYKNGYWSRFCQEKRQILAGKVAADVCLDLGWIGYDLYENVSLTYGCTGLYVTCSPGLATSLHHYQVLGGGYLWPWNAFVYSDGTLICSAVLLRAEWLLTSSMCIQNVS